MRISSDAAARDMRHYDSFSSSQLGSSISRHIDRWSKQGTLRGDLEGVFCQPFLWAAMLIMGVGVSIALFKTDQIPHHVSLNNDT